MKAFFRRILVSTVALMLLLGTALPVSAAGFSDVPTEDRNMATAFYQQKIVEGICDGVDEYFAKNG